MLPLHALEMFLARNGDTSSHYVTICFGNVSPFCSLSRALSQANNGRGASSSACRESMSRNYFPGVRYI